VGYAYSASWTPDCVASLPPIVYEPILSTLYSVTLEQTRVRYISCGLWDVETAPEHSGAMPCWIIFATGVRTDVGCMLLIAGEARPRRLHRVDQCVICQKIGGKQSPVASAFMEKSGGEPLANSRGW
jgi:hypothetical protein